MWTVSWSSPQSSQITRASYVLRARKKKPGRTRMVRPGPWTGLTRSLLDQSHPANERQVIVNASFAGHRDALADDRAVDVAVAADGNRAQRSVDVGEEVGAALKLHLRARVEHHDVKVLGQVAVGDRLTTEREV